MNKVFKGLTAALIFGVPALAFAPSAQAAPFYFGDDYIGGNYSNNPDDVIGRYSVFSIDDGVVHEVEQVGGDLRVKIHTNYAGQQDTPRALGTEYGALFIGDNNGYDPVTGGGQNSLEDDPDRFDYALSFDYSPGEGSFTGANALDGTLYSVGDWNAVAANSGITESQASGGFRRNQSWKEGAVSSVELDDQGNAIEGTVTIEKGTNDSSSANFEGNGYMEFVIKGFFEDTSIYNNLTLNDGFIVGWAMSCANDIVIGVVQGSFNAPPVPLPAGFVLLLSGLLGLGWLGRSRAKQA